MKRLLRTCLMLLAVLALSACGSEVSYDHTVNPLATITMENGGVMRFELHLEVAPNTVANFCELANDHFYDGLEFFRVVPGVLIQSGCPHNDGTGLTDHTIRGEFAANGYDNSLSHRRGVLSMARVGGEKFNSASTQFFIMQGNYPEYDGQFAAFGTALDEGTLKVLDSIASQPVDGHNVPMVRQRIATIRVNTHGLELEADKIYLKTPEPEATTTPEPTPAGTPSEFDSDGNPLATASVVQTPVPTARPDPNGTPPPPEYYFATSTPPPYDDEPANLPADDSSTPAPLPEGGVPDNRIRDIRSDILERIRESMGLKP